ncbi:FMN reductase (NADPH) [Saccharomonospora sp. CUA-673]|uniref:NADPH-dependent FMN reductase n=1 Tax=Saccharomonospora sp. CUA-673 TaxID=1904969 RepID=UPI00096698A1|nr:NADPH-dependent FMN reductase [Saccharomonospora sp. CUA-673]OLT43223.1 FMN reductase (NADPH) [Saccharomonospora sp. CUA-673]
MSRIVALSGSPSAASRTEAVVQYLATRLRGYGHDVTVQPVRTLPPGALVSADAAHPDICTVVDTVSRADGVIVASPVYKAAYSGLLKLLLDVFPQYALAGKKVLPLATGGTPAHVLAIDYAFRPMLHALGADHVMRGYFLLDRLITVDETGVSVEDDARGDLLSRVDDFSEALLATGDIALVS